MAVAAESARDVAAAVDIARKHGIRLVVKGGGHSYFGNSNAADSLLVWTRRMDSVELHDAFRCAGAPDTSAAVPAVSIGAGAIWGRVYRRVAVEGGRYVQGGGCLTVGVAGFVQGGGFGSLSKQFGTGAGNLLEAEVVTADGQVRTANRFRDPELFFALRGGGGGTFGIVTRLTLMTHPLPPTIGAVLLSVTATDERSWRALVDRMIGFYSEALFNSHWGEQLSFAPGRRLTVSMLCHSLSEQEMRALWQPLIRWISASPGVYKFDSDPVFVAVAGRDFWNPDQLRKLPGIVLPDERPNAPASNIFWAANLEEAGQVLHSYKSLWLPAALLDEGRRSALVEAIVAGSAHWPLSLHMNKGLAGGSEFARRSALETAMNPAVADAFALLICASSGPPAWPGVGGHEPDVALGRRDAAKVALAVEPVSRLVGEPGAYMSESDYFDAGWKAAYWGRNYPRLATAKRRYDPANFFHGHHCVEP
jgi:FAD/FMN-containing dehydrogenase